MPTPEVHFESLPVEPVSPEAIHAPSLAVTFNPPVSTWAFPGAADSAGTPGDLWADLLKATVGDALANNLHEDGPEARKRMETVIHGVLRTWEAQARLKFPDGWSYAT